MLPQTIFPTLLETIKMAAVNNPVCRYKFTIIPEYFVDYYKIADDSPGGKATTQPSLGLLDKKFGDAADDVDAKPWERFTTHVNRLNAESSDGVEYKVLYLTRHGLGFHNVQAAKVGTAEWDVSSKSMIEIQPLRNGRDTGHI